MDKIKEVVETKTEEISVKLDDVLDKVEEVKIEEPKIIEKIVDKLDDIPVINEAMQNIVEVVDGRSFTCSCWGWLFVLRISRKSRNTPPSKPEEKTNTVSNEPSQTTPPEASLHSTVPPQVEEHPASTS